MTDKQLQNRNEKSLPLKVWQVGDGQHLVESSEGKILYKVIFRGATKYCTCKDYESNKGPDFVCKHILAVINGNGNIQKVNGAAEKPKLDERFIMSLQGRDFVKYAGLLDLAHQLGLCKLTVEPIQYPSKENNEAICRAVAETVNGEIFIDVGDANPNNCNRMIAQHLLRMASTRAKARVLRDLTNVGMTALEELGDDLEEDEVPQNGGNKKPPKANKAPPKQADEKKSQATPPPTAEKKAENQPPAQPAADKPKQEAASGGVPIFQAQQRAIQNLAQRRAISPEELTKLLQDEYGVNGLQDLTSGQASSLIGYLQKSA